MILLPFPPSILSGHQGGRWRPKANAVRQWRQWAFAATRDAKVQAPTSGDIVVHVRFIPPNRRGDRTNYPNRCKPIFDGIADALRVNDRRFVPAFEYVEPEKPGRLEIIIRGVE